MPYARKMSSLGTSRFDFVLVVSACVLVPGLPVQAETADLETRYRPTVSAPAYPRDQGPVVYLDEGHYNRHLYGGLGSFIAFKDVLRTDGYRVVAFRNPFTRASLRGVRILVISTPQDKRNLGPPWHNPTYSAFTDSEIATLKHWTENGGSLFLIVDHHPFAGASDKLAQEFGLVLFNGHAEDKGSHDLDIFHKDDQTLKINVITQGRNSAEAITSVKTFAGAAIEIPGAASPILVFDDDWVQYLPETAWDFTGIEPVSIAGLCQGAYLNYGSGKVVVFGDANMFSAQKDEYGEIAGFIDPEADQNQQLLLNIVHYLDGLLD